ncbi:MAG: signal peptidase I [Anaerolineales bacterium]
MKKFPSWYKSISSAFFLVGIALIWSVFAPLQFGGNVAYIIVNGNSMEPLYHKGDLVIVRRAEEYQVGDIAAYMNPQIGPVIHRIIKHQGDTFLFKGDHNTWVDSYSATAADIVGKAWIHLPGMGKVIQALRIPWVLSLVVAMCGALFLFTILPSKKGSRRKLDRHGEKGRQVAMKTNPNRNDEWLFILTVIALVAGIFTIIAFTRPLTHYVSKDIKYQQKGTFSYSAQPTLNQGVYDTGSVETGDPMFQQLVRKANFKFDYQLASDSPSHFNGTIALMARLSSGDGWQHTLVLQPSKAFSGASASISGVLDLDAIQAYLNNLQTQTGIQRLGYNVIILPKVTLQGSIAGQAIHESFTPQLPFQFDSYEMQLVRDPNGPDPRYPSSDGSVSTQVVEPNYLALMGLKLFIFPLRWISLGILVLTIAGIVMVAIFRYRSSQRGNQVDRIQSVYGSGLVEVKGGDTGQYGRIIDVQTIDDLAKVAESQNKSMLHTITEDQAHVYFIQDDDTLYRYMVNG